MQLQSGYNMFTNSYKKTRRRYFPAASSLRFRFKQLVVLEEQRNAPQSGESYENIHDPAYYAFRAAAEPCHKVKLEKSHKTPVYSAYDKQKKRYSINYSHITVFLCLFCRHAHKYK